MSIGHAVANHIKQMIEESDGTPKTKEVLLRDCVPILQGTIDNYYEKDNRPLPDEGVFIVVSRHAGMIIKSPRDQAFLDSIRKELKPTLIKNAGEDFAKSMWGVLQQAVARKDAQGAAIATLLRIEQSGGIDKYFKMLDSVTKPGYIGVGVVMAWAEQTDDVHEDTAGLITITALPVATGPVSGSVIDKKVLH